MFWQQPAGPAQHAASWGRHSYTSPFPPMMGMLSSKARSSVCLRGLTASEAACHTCGVSRYWSLHPLSSNTKATDEVTLCGRSMAEATLRQGLLQYLPNSCSLAAYSLQRTSSPNHCACHGHIMSCPAPLCSVLSPHVLSHPVSSRATLSCPIVFHPVPSHHVPFCPTVSCLVPSCLIMSHPVLPIMFHPVPSHPVLFHQILSCHMSPYRHVSDPVVSAPRPCSEAK